MRLRCILAGTTLLFLAVGPARPAEPDRVGLDLFEKKIRPVLVQECYACHSTEARQAGKLRGGLLLDSAATLRRGGDSGPVVVPGKPAESLLLQALRHDGPKMPPTQKLPDAVVSDFEKWVALGAPDPRAETASGDRKPGIDLEAGRRHWAYQPIRKPALPAVRDAAWPRNEIDTFTLAKLEARSLKPVRDADREILVRRLYFDLIGLPPAPDEVDATLSDASPDWYEKLVDRLLASPQFGERWGRHWLDVTRFAESLTLRGFVLKDAWRYRDYVIDTFNQDRRFDKFLAEQVAGDLLPAASVADRRRQLTATTFLALGNTNLEEQDKKQLRMDVVDEQLDTLGKAFLAQTIGCARCHDHKFDPIPAKDYYAVAGILRSTKALEHANVSKWLELPLPAEPGQEELLKKHETAVAALQTRIKEAKAVAGTKVADKGKGVVAVKDLPGVVLDDTQAKKVGAWKDSTFSGSYIGKGYIHDENKDKGEKTLTFVADVPQAGKYEVRLGYVSGTNRATNVPVTVFSADGEKTIRVNQREAPAIDGRFISLGQYRFENNGAHYVFISNEETDGHVIVDAVQFLPAEADKETRRQGDKETGSADAVKRLEQELQQLIKTGPKRDTVISVVEEKDIGDTQVHVRGSVHNLGEKAPRGFLQVVPVRNPPAIPANESGRRQLGEWLAHSDNPLPARVMANRAWHWLFGAGIVRTVDNFGTTGEAPSHPELLDFLAARFQEEGWSVKKLIRLIVLSRTYQLSSAGDARCLAADPENRLCWRMNRRRLDAECIRDALLQVSGQLRPEMGGPTFKADVQADYGYKHTDMRRSVYTPVFRNALPDLFEVFDFADPSVTTGRRNVSTSAPQALFLLNHPFVKDQAKAAAVRLLAEGGLDEVGRVVLAYRWCLGRRPTEAEQQLAQKHLARASDRQIAWAELFHALFASMDFRFIN